MQVVQGLCRRGPAGNRCRRVMVLMVGAGVLYAPHAVAEPLTGADVVRLCDHKHAGSDQRSRLTIVNRNQDGKEKTNVYLRLWKDYEGRGGVDNKMILFTESTEGKGTAFMRWEYRARSGKPEDQWLYSPATRKIRRIAVRDLNESFLGTVLTIGDISRRPVEADRHRLVRVDYHPPSGRTLLEVQSVPLEDSPRYGKVVSVFSLRDGWDTCEKNNVFYYDTNDYPLKRQRITWQRVGDAWSWKQVEVVNVQTKQASLFRIDDVEVDVGLKDELFTERTLRRGYTTGR